MASVPDVFLRYRDVFFFAGGFLFDFFTLNRIDGALDLVLQGLYLAGITGLIVLQGRGWAPTGRRARLWAYNVEALHFFFGGLLSAYVIFYTRSGTVAQSWLFLACVLGLMIGNEMPQLKRGGTKLRLGLHAFCLASYLNYLLPVLLGRMGALVFALALSASVLGSAGVVRLLAGEDKRARLALGWPPAAVLSALALAYALKWVPPVPLSLQYAGVFHKVERAGAQYRLEYARPPWYRFWSDDDGVFRARPGDQINCFVRIFAPTRFSHRVALRWQSRDPKSGRFMTSDRVPLDIAGGRGAGYRGYATKARWRPGEHRVIVETEDGRAIGVRRFRVVEDAGRGERRWKARLM